MVDNSSDPGYELVLDNRRLIVAFIVLVLICGCFFVVGFVEGKRQGYQAGSQTAAESAAREIPDVPEEADSGEVPSESESTEAKKDTENPQLNWYKKVRQAPASEIAAPSPEPTPAPPKETVERAEIPPPAKVSGYTVQVGAFRQRQQAEVKEKELRAKGFDCRIEVPESSEDLYLVKVGRFKSKAEATAMRLRLKKSGFNSFIKTN